MSFDITEHYGLVRRVFYAKFASRCATAGLDCDDVFQLVCMAIDRKDRGGKPYSPERSSRSNYVYVVSNSVVNHEMEKLRTKKAAFNQVGNDCDAATLGAPFGWPGGKAEPVRPRCCMAHNDCDGELTWTQEPGEAPVWVCEYHLENGPRQQALFG